MKEVTLANGKTQKVIRAIKVAPEPKKESIAEKALSPLKKLWKKLTGK